MISLVEHSAQGATIALGQRELLLLMALIQEGRESFGCNTDVGEALDQFFCTTNIQVEQERRALLKKAMMHQTISVVPKSTTSVHKGAVNA